MSDQTSRTVTEAISACWQAQPNNLIGGWCISPADDPRTPADGALLLGDFMSQAIAEHVVDTHNRQVSKP